MFVYAAAVAKFEDQLKKSVGQPLVLFVYNAPRDSIRPVGKHSFSRMHDPVHSCTLHICLSALSSLADLSVLYLCMVVYMYCRQL